ncbi:MAG: hypothetical protein JWO13_2149 [Acidobacteriales bacterium]|nr:hypothetical protein [Terriglobales bacterium]
MWRAFARVSGRTAGSNKFVRAGWGAAEATLRSFARVGHVLWLEITGFFFLIFALIGGAALVRECRAASVDQKKIVAAAVFTVMFAYFGVTSFVRSRRRAKG